MTSKSLTLKLCVPVLLLSACASGPSYSNFPKSDLKQAKATDETAIAFQGKAPGCASMKLLLAPELEPGKYGEVIKLGLGWTKIGIPVNWSFHGNGKTLHRYKIPAGRYAVTNLICVNSNAVKSTPRNKQVKYGEFNVVSGKTTYIGNITAGARSKHFVFNVKDDSEQAKQDFLKKHPKRQGEFQVDLMSNVLDPTEAMKKALENRDELMKMLKEVIEKRKQETAKEP